MRTVSSCDNTCGGSKTVTICGLPPVVRLRKLEEADNLTLGELDRIGDGILLDVDYITEAESA